MRALPIFFVVMLAACTPFPDLDDTLDPAVRDAAFPKLIPLEPLFAGVPDTRTTPAVLANVDAQIAALNARANRLRGPVIRANTRVRMRRGVTLQ
jgi:hypothetical protein